MAATHEGVGISQMNGLGGRVRHQTAGVWCGCCRIMLVTINEFDHGVFALYTPSRHSSPKVRVFIDFLIGLFKSETYRLSDAEFAQGVRPS